MELVLLFHLDFLRLLGCAVDATCAEAACKTHDSALAIEAESLGPAVAENIARLERLGKLPLLPVPPICQLKHLLLLAAMGVSVALEGEDFLDKRFVNRK